MNVGTKSLLFGVHQVFWHPWTVALAWRHLYHRWPVWWEWVAIFCHDLGYWGCPNMDGEEGQRHPEKGAKLAQIITLHLAALLGNESDRAVEFSNDAFQLAIGHSRFYAQKYNVPLSKLFRADKVSLLFDPKKFYLFRGWLSGEVFEYRNNAAGRFNGGSVEEWFDWYLGKVKEKWL